MIEPSSPRELAERLHLAAQRKQRIRVGGHFSKNLMAGPLGQDTGMVLSTTRMDRVLAYEPSDLTISVEAGVPFRKLQQVLAANRQMLPLDPLFPDRATIGGIVAANTNGSRRRQYGTVRDLVIGMQFATLAGRLVQSGGMVVKNVAGLDLGKMMIGSFGTLAAIAVVNFKVVPVPAAERTFALEFAALPDALAVRDKLLRGALQPGAIDLMSPSLASEFRFRGWTLLLWFGGSDALMNRAEREVAVLAPQARVRDAAVWEAIPAYTARFLEKFADGAVIRVSSILSEVGDVLLEVDAPAIARAGTGVTYAFFVRAEAAAKWVRQAHVRNRKALIEFASEEARARYDLWPDPGSDFAIMKKVKHLFDPDHLLNRDRLYRHL